MYRTCSKATKAKIANIKLPAHSPGWLRGAVSNARSNNPMSEKQELRMIAALGIATETGIFGADMDVALNNDGPVTIWMDTENL